ncbi:single-strand DNA-binding protein [Saccharopolyspora lacisalsi]|uniref:Single-stranded DNA-binding protein n=1 Tax=Halosaccharopolyspora lacisalsi TaxID=1000566 RepID=A0A839E201_9PSEU|nr:single-stranded DNA-binding protein [Halosaccharopolyspora lacisalsi]MBA8827100.1 single-strand DNA-binding protein [Halosaccharopolyspora lacisalsi]
MSGLPEVTIAGTLVADPEIKYLDSGACVANFTIAANDRRFDRDRGEWVDASATFLRCQIWRQAAEHVVESLGKGQRVLAVGALKQRSYETAEGEKRTAFELNVTELGPSLKFATATVRKAARSNNSGDADPRGSAPPAGTSAKAADEPPF